MTTIVDLKKQFLNSQIRLLSAGLSLPQHELDEKTVSEVVARVNTLIRQHNRACYSSQGVRHVAEQIDSLYWNAADVSASGQVGEVEDVLQVGSDFRRDEVIERLPDEWPDEEDEHELTSYTTLKSQLEDLSRRRREARERVVRYKHLQHLLIPYKNPKENVQPNLVTRDGELGAELDRMRMLMARAAGKVHETGAIHERGEEGGEVLGAREKVDAIVGMQVGERDDTM